MRQIPTRINNYLQAWILLLFAIVASQNPPQEISHEFWNKDASYFYQAEFTTPEDSQCILRVVYDFEHLSKIVTSMDSIVLVRQDTSWYDVRYYYKHRFFSSVMTFRKELNTKKNSVTFHLTEIKQKSSFFIPRIVAMTGEYRVKAVDNGTQLSFIQNITLKSRILNRFVMYFSRKEAKKTIKTLRKHIQRSCKG